MSTQPPNPQLMGRTNVAMAVAQPKPKPASKANTTPKGKMQMHRRSRTGLLDFPCEIPVMFPCRRFDLELLLTELFKVATHADYEERSATKALLHALLANTLAFDANTNGPCGGATMINAGCRKTTSR